MNVRKIHFPDVKRIVVTAPGASGVDLTAVWTNIGTQNTICFEALYRYDGLEDGYLYCPYCGNVWKPTVHPTIEKCGCDETKEQLCNLTDINSMIQEALTDVDPMTVDIEFNDGYIERYCTTR